LGGEWIKNMIFWAMMGEEIEKSMAVALLFTVYPQIYGFFASFNYINDNFYDMWYTQVCLIPKPKTLW